MSYVQKVSEKVCNTLEKRSLIFIYQFHTSDIKYCTPCQVSLASDFLYNHMTRDVTTTFGYDYMLRQVSSTLNYFALVD